MNEALCEYEEITGEKPDDAGLRYVRCCHCGHVEQTIFPLEKLQRVCPRPSERRPLPPRPNIFQMGVSYLAAYVRHVARGRPQVTAEQTLSRFRLCSACELYNSATGQCNICGCYIAPRLVPEWPNKLTWADEECPKEPQEWLRLDKTESQSTLP